MMRQDLPVHGCSVARVYSDYETAEAGIGESDVSRRLGEFGFNILPHGGSTPFILVFLRQFLDPLIYVLLFAAVLSLGIARFADSFFILGVLAVNALIGALQERSAQQSADALHHMVSDKATVIRGGQARVVEARFVVPGDLVRLESGDKVPADMRLVRSHDLQVDESLLTGESMPVNKQFDTVLPVETPVADRVNMVFSGTLVVRGRSSGVVTSTGSHTQLGQIAADVLQGEKAVPPLIQRMQRFTWWLTMVMMAVSIALGMVMLWQGAGWVDVLLVIAALAVAAIPEGLPVAITIALSVSMRRMARRHVIARRLVTVEALGSCTYIATDKTGTLTRNEIAVEKILLPSQHVIEVAAQSAQGGSDHMPQLQRLLLAAVLANEGEISRRGDRWHKHGDSADVALLLCAHQFGMEPQNVLAQYQRLALIPFESVNRYSASLHLFNDASWISVKGAVETLLPMCDSMLVDNTPVVLDRKIILQQAEAAAASGYRVLALAGGACRISDEVLREHHLTQLTFYGLMAMIDPLRAESAPAVARCRAAGIQVAMLTGDHPVTAYAIARELGLAHEQGQVVTGPDFQQMSEQQKSHVLRQARVFARMEPHQKLTVVTRLESFGHFVAVTGDGANDAPALRAAHVGVAMGRAGTDVARETADMIVTDDNFSSIVAGVEEGRIAYNNVRKVIHLLISTGAGEMVLFMLSMSAGLPIPLTAVQLLWLNLVTNGVQHIALAFEPGEGHELDQPPREPREPLFNAVMIQRVLLAAMTIGVVAAFCFYNLLLMGFSVEQSRNGTLLLMVLFENIHVFNSRSETRSVFRHNPLRNPLLLFGTLAAQCLHLGAMYLPGLSDILQVSPIAVSQWFYFLSLALTLLVVSELYKWFRQITVTTAASPK